MRTHRQFSFGYGDLDEVSLTITVHMRGAANSVELGYEIRSGPGGEPLQIEALGQHWETAKIEEVLPELREMLLASRDLLIPF